MVYLIFQAALQDSQVELETYKQTRQGLDEMYNVVWKQYKEEKCIRQVWYQQGSSVRIYHACGNKRCLGFLCQQCEFHMRFFGLTRLKN